MEKSLDTNLIIDHFYATGSSNSKVIESCLKVKRHNFLPSHLKSLAYSDANINYKENRYLLDISSFSYMLDVCDYLKKGYNNYKNILVVGSGLGYGANVIGLMYPESEITAIDSDKELIKLSNNNQEGVSNITFEHVESLEDFNLSKTYDLIFIEGAFYKIKESWLKSCNKNACLVGVIKDKHIGNIVQYNISNGEVESQKIYKNSPAMFLPNLELEEDFIF